MIKTNFKKNLFYSFIVIVIIILDRLSKLYVLNLAEIEQQVDIHIFSYLNLYLIWNTGIGFGLFSSDQSFYYNLVTRYLNWRYLMVIKLRHSNNNCVQQDVIES